MEPNADSEHHLMIGHITPQNMPIDPRTARFPCCIVWTPLPVISWLVPFIGHMGICREDGVILDFAGPNFVCVDNFTFGAVARYIQINKEKLLLQWPASSLPHDWRRDTVSSVRVETTACFCVMAAVPSAFDATHGAFGIFLNMIL
ncbi:RTE1-homolog [Actinidia rufa]|uniref:RTE1-homolog n=1 Tax=Actinidia rufa TaxID=165716 RepID=A0A7J0EMW9_9ERIC|nr:RTE1-homolog [Actinidia rufa]